MTEATLGGQQAEGAGVAAVGMATTPIGLQSVEEERGGSTFRSLRYRDYRLLWIGTLFTSSGQWIQQITIGWLAYDLTGSAFLVATVNGFRSLPLLLLGPFGGVAADRVERRSLLLWTQIFLIVATGLMATVILAGALKVWHLFFFTLLTGVAWSFNNPVRQSIVPNLVPARHLMNALALNSTGFNITRVLGPSLAGLMLAKIGAGENFLLQTLAYVGVAAMVFQMTVPAIPRSNDVSVAQNLSEGARYVWRTRTLRTQLALALVPVVIGLPYITLLPIITKETLHQGAEGYGLLSSAVGLGAVAGTLTIATLGNLQRKGLILLGATFGLGASLVLFSLSRTFELSLFLMVIVGAFQMTYMTTNQTVLQLMVPDAMRGRVMGIYMLNQGLLPLGSLFAGVLADVTDAPTAIFCMGAVVCALALVFATFARDLRQT